MTGTDRNIPTTPGRSPPPIASSQLVVPVGRTEVVLYDVRVDRQTQRSTGVHGELEVQAGQHACEHDVLAQGDEGGVGPRGLGEPDATNRVNGPLPRVGFEE